jgi:PIN domain nuclease of toxin-antitoxin system
MNVLLDTNALLWAAYAPDKLTPKAEGHYASADQIFVSMVSLWEIGLKMSRGGFVKLAIPSDWDKLLWQWMRDQDFRIIGVELEHCRAIQDLPFYHKDPFDRMLIAQALQEKCAVIGSDEHFDAYGVQRIW